MVETNAATADLNNLTPAYLKCDSGFRQAKPLPALVKSGGESILMRDFIRSCILPSAA
jgi:hypothetical protein